METEARLVEIRDRRGELLFTFVVTERPFGEKPKDPKGNDGGKGDGKSNPSDPLMTDAQKRYLFRILADQGKEGDEAHGYLKKVFQVSSLAEVTKTEASQQIERLLKESKGGGETR